MTIQPFGLWGQPIVLGCLLPRIKSAQRFRAQTVIEHRMVEGTLKGWFSAPRIYIENVRDGEAAYQVTAEAILRSLS